MLDSRLYRCPSCNYIGRGFHSDRAIDAEMAARFDTDRAEFTAQVEALEQPVVLPNTVQAEFLKLGKVID
jgi:hypothetical protein